MHFYLERMKIISYYYLLLFEPLIKMKHAYIYTEQPFYVLFYTLRYQTLFCKQWIQLSIIFVKPQYYF